MIVTRGDRCEKVAHFRDRKDESMREPGQLINDNNNNIVMETKASETSEISSDGFLLSTLGRPRRQLCA